MKFKSLYKFKFHSVVIQNGGLKGKVKQLKITLLLYHLTLNTSYNSINF